MLIAGTHGAAFHDGKERRLIFNEAQFKKVIQSNFNQRRKNEINARFAS